MNKQPRRFMRLKEVKYQVGLGRTSIYSAIKAGTFPKPHSLGARAVAWASDEISGWIDSRISATGCSK